MEQVISLPIKKADCSCGKTWDFFDKYDEARKPEDGILGKIIHDCADLTVYQKKMKFIYVRKLSTGGLLTPQRRKSNI